MMEGREPEQIEKMVVAVSEAISSGLPTPITTMRVIVNEMKPHQYGVGGKPWQVVVEERRKQEESR